MPKNHPHHKSMPEALHAGTTYKRFQMTFCQSSTVFAVPKRMKLCPNHLESLLSCQGAVVGETLPISTGRPPRKSIRTLFQSLSPPACDTSGRRDDSYRGSRTLRERILSIPPNSARHSTRPAFIDRYFVAPTSVASLRLTRARALRLNRMDSHPRSDIRITFARRSSPGFASNIPNRIISAVIFDAACCVTPMRRARAVIDRSHSIRC